VDIAITAKDIFGGQLSYPTPRLPEFPHSSARWASAKPIWAALDHFQGACVGYDGRARPPPPPMAGAVTALMCGEKQRAVRTAIAERLGPFSGYARIAAMLDGHSHCTAISCAPSSRKNVQLLCWAPPYAWDMAWPSAKNSIQIAGSRARATGNYRLQDGWIPPASGPTWRS